jgi:short-subunit dehydrogenase
VGLSLSLRLEGADLGVKVSCVCPGFVRTNVYQNAGVVNMPAVAALSGRAREQAAGAPGKMMKPAREAQVILSGVARNQAVIAFPASIRWARRANGLLPHVFEREMLRRWRKLRRYRTAATGVEAKVPGT